MYPIQGATLGNSLQQKDNTNTHGRARTRRQHFHNITVDTLRPTIFRSNSKHAALNSLHSPLRSPPTTNEFAVEARAGTQHGSLTTSLSVPESVHRNWMQARVVNSSERYIYIYIHIHIATPDILRYSSQPLVIRRNAPTRERALRGVRRWISF